MKNKWIQPIVRHDGVISVVLVDHDGLTISSSDESSDLTASLSALLMEKILKEVEKNSVDKWSWTQFETENTIISIMNAGVGLLVIIMNHEADIEAVRNEAYVVKQDIYNSFEWTEKTMTGGNN